MAVVVSFHEYIRELVRVEEVGVSKLLKFQKPAIIVDDKLADYRIIVV